MSNTNEWPELPDDFPSPKDLEKLKELLNEHQTTHRIETGGVRMDCVHDSCPECHGTGVSKNGAPCIHSAACYCPRCAIYG